MEEFTSRLKYPNPLQPSGIEFELQESANVTLTILDESGNEIKELLRNRSYPAGRHEVYVDPALYRNGMYFYRFEIQKEKENFLTGKLVTPEKVTAWVIEKIRELAAQEMSIVFSGSFRTLYEAEEEIKSNHLQKHQISQANWDHKLQSSYFIENESHIAP